MSDLFCMQQQHTLCMSSQFCMHACQGALASTHACTSSTATFLTTVERMCCQEPPSYLTETRVVHHALQYAIGIAVAERVRYATGVSYIRAVQLPWFSRFQSQSLWGLYICPSSTRGTLLYSLSRVCSPREAQLLHDPTNYFAFSRQKHVPHAQAISTRIFLPLNLH